MTLNQTVNNIGDLLDKYRRNEITTEEFKLMLRHLNDASDDELRDLLQTEWDEFDKFADLPEEKISALYDAIRPAKTVRRRWNSRWIQVAAAVLILILGGVVTYSLRLYNSYQQLAAETFTINSSETGTTKVTLPDGSTVVLNAASTISYKQDYGREDRKVELSGEGYFKVKHDDDHPFEVKSKCITVKDVGTEFNFYAYDDKDSQEVTLKSGRLVVVNELRDEEQAELSPHQKATLEKRTGRLKVTSTVAEKEYVWMGHQLRFEHDRLGDVFFALERRFNVDITVDNPAMLNDTYTGSFDDKDVRGGLETLQINYGFNFTIDGKKINIKMKKLK